MSDERYLMVAKISNMLYPYFCHTERAKYFLTNEEFIKDYKRFDKLSTHSLDRKYSVMQFLKLALQSEGDTAECGVYQGATSYFILKYGSKERMHHVFDSFEGLSKSETVDGTYWPTWALSCGLSEVQKNLEEFKNVAYYKWWIPHEFHKVADKTFSFVYIDVDLYQPTKDSLTFFYERLSEGGVIMCDDSGFTSCPGARQAIDELQAETWAVVLELSSGQSVVMRKK